MTIDDQVKQNTSDLRKVEGEVGELKVTSATTTAKLEAMDDRQEERHKATLTGMDGIAEAIAAQRKEEADARTASDDYRRQREEREAKTAETKAAWWRETFDSKTVMMILALIAGALGISYQIPSAADMVNAAKPTAEEPVP